MRFQSGPPTRPAPPSRGVAAWFGCGYHRPMTLKAIIFDVDGTLAETEEAHRAAFNQAFAERGLPWHWDRAVYGALLKVSGGKERMAAFAGPGHDDLIAALHRRKTELYTQAVAAGGVPLRPGIAALIAEAWAAGLVQAIATTTTRANVLALLGGHPEWCTVMACADDAPVKKPDPQVYHFVLARLGLSPGDCLAIEDSANGVRAARAAGIPVVVTRSAYTQDDDVTGALAVFPDLAEVGLARLRGLHASA